MYKVIVLLSIVLVPLVAFDTSLLTKEKQEVLEQKEKEIEARARGLKYNWISPLNLSASYSKSSTDDDFGYNASVQLSQDIFRSGGIWHTLAYADSKLFYDLITLDIEKAALFEELFTGLLTLERLKLELQQSQYNLKNSEIEIFLKIQLYKTGNADITELNSALMDKHGLLKTILTLKENVLEQEIALKAITDQPLETITVPVFKDFSQEKFIANSLKLMQVKLESQLADTAYNLTKSSYLPSLSVSGQYGYRDFDTTLENRYHSVGLTLSMPIDYNAKAALEEDKASFLQSKSQISDTESDEIAVYQQHISKINNYKDHNTMIQKNITLYSELIEINEKGFKAGYKSGYDVQTLQNTKKIDELELKINELNIQMELAQLLFATNLGAEYNGK